MLWEPRIEHFFLHAKNAGFDYRLLAIKLDSHNILRRNFARMLVITRYLFAECVACQIHHRQLLWLNAACRQFYKRCGARPDAQEREAGTQKKRCREIAEAIPPRSEILRLAQGLLPNSLKASYPTRSRLFTQLAQGASSARSWSMTGRVCGLTPRHM